MPLPHRPVLDRSCRLVRDDTRYLFERAGTLVTLEGGATLALLPALLPLLDGSRTLDDLVTELGPAAAPAVTQLLECLESHRLIVDGYSSEAGAELVAAAIHAAATVRSTTPGAALERLGEAEIDVIGRGASAVEIARLLQASGIEGVRKLEIDDETSPGAFVVAVPEAGEVAALDRVNGRAIDHGAAWLQVLPYDGRATVVGPLFLPSQSACRRCYVLRRAACSGYEDDFDRVESAESRLQAPSMMAAISAGLATLLAVRWLATSDPRLPGRHYVFESASVLRLTHELVLRVPRCPACGPGDSATPSPWFERA